jgi:hypothetical protein
MWRCDRIAIMIHGPAYIGHCRQVVLIDRWSSGQVSLYVCTVCVGCVEYSNSHGSIMYRKTYGTLQYRFNARDWFEASFVSF